MDEFAARNVDLKTLFQDLQREMQAKLDKVRRNVKHPTSKGTGTENAWVDMLARYLPHRYECRRAAVVDASGGCSQQVDVVIFDPQYSPFILNDQESDVQYLPAESVYAVLEVKQDLTKEHIEEAGGKVASVRRLHRTSAPVTTINGVKQRTPFPILGGVLATESAWTPPFGQPFEDALRSLEPYHQIDFGCALRHGSFEVVTDGDMRIQAWTSNTGLVRFLLVLLRRLQNLGTALPIEFGRYESNLD